MPPFRWDSPLVIVLCALAGFMVINLGALVFIYNLLAATLYNITRWLRELAEKVDETRTNASNLSRDVIRLLDESKERAHRAERRIGRLRTKSASAGPARGMPSCLAKFSLEPGDEFSREISDWLATAPSVTLARANAAGWRLEYDGHDAASSGARAVLALVEFYRDRDDYMFSLYNRVVRDGMKLAVTMPPAQAEAVIRACRPQDMIAITGHGIMVSP
jgi:hypothetical protein